MELKEYQSKALNTVRLYLGSLREWRDKQKQIATSDAETASVIDFPQKAWSKIGKSNYISKRNNHGEHLPNFCLKIPTGGGKTLLAVKTIDAINSGYLKRKTGLVLWVVPTTQIYRQTYQGLRSREHPYRQHLDLASGGRTMVIEKNTRFTPQDVRENLVVLMLMLPSASRQNKETLKIFQDSGGFNAFFPTEDNIQGHKILLEKFPNLDAYGKKEGFFGRQVKTSLGNTLRILSPIIILDEGHKAYSPIAQNTLCDFNPCIVVELSATPSRQSNILVDIKGVELAREEMIKLDLHLINKASPDWKDAMLSSVEKQKALERCAKEYGGNTGEYIRPICLIQVERTGSDQQGKKFIHSEDVKSYLVKICGIPEEQVAIKTSDKDDIEGIDLLSPCCPVRYIITKQALQEGWDCSFAYILTILTNPSSKNNLTQLVGRILRQPKAKKTKVKELDESYVYCFQQRGQTLLESVRAGFQQEGLGDLSGRIFVDVEEKKNERHQIEVREKFKKFAGKIYLPVFVIKDESRWRQLNYSMDILSRIDWSKADFTPAHQLTLSAIEEKDLEVTLGLSNALNDIVQQKGTMLLKEGILDIDLVFVTRHIVDAIPNPWIAYEVARDLFSDLLQKWPENVIINNYVFIIEELKKQAEKERDRLAQVIFSSLVNDKAIKFVLLKDEQGYRLPSQIPAHGATRILTRENGQPLQLSLFDTMPEESFNSFEKPVAWYLEGQGKLLWWYRNIAKQDYAIQGWRKEKIYPDFIFSSVDEKDGSDYDKVFVVETKGLYLKNENTTYKQDVFALCNRLAEPNASWNDLGMDFPEKKMVFEVVFEDEWQNKINELLA